MLNRGNSLDEVGDVLRHRSRTTTTDAFRRQAHCARWPDRGRLIQSPDDMLADRLDQYIIERAFAKAGVTPPQGRVRAHLLRHALAVNMLNRGNSLDEVGDVLRHRSRTDGGGVFVGHHDLCPLRRRGDLRPLARPWPVEGESR